MFQARIFRFSAEIVGARKILAEKHVSFVAFLLKTRSYLSDRVVQLPRIVDRPCEMDGDADDLFAVEILFDFHVRAGIAVLGQALT